MRTLKRALCVMLAAVLLPGVGTAAASPGAPSGKEEVVYVTLDAGGTVRGIYVINILDGGDILDYGNYTSVRNLTTNDAFEINGDEISARTAEDRLYYEGMLDTADIPWNIAVTYFMDGQDYPSDDIAGRSGKLEIRIMIEKNENCSSTFFENYALQASVQLDTGRCTNITSEGATPADVGRYKQLSYIVLPGAGADLRITADVTDFEMDPIEITGLLLNIGGEIDIDAGSLGLSTYENAISDLQQGTEILDSAANQIKAGAEGLESGSAALQNGANSLSSGLADLAGSSADIQNGAQQLADALFASATVQLRQTLIASGMTASQAAAITLSQDNYIAVFEQLAGSAPDALTELETQLDGVVSYLNGLRAYTGGVAEAAAGARSVASGAADLNSGAAALRSGTEALAQGTGELADQTGGFDTDLTGAVQEKIDEISSAYSSDGYTPVSFVSDKNTGIRSVQFVIKTEGVSLPESAAIQEEQTETVTFWQKLLHLFGLD